MTRQLRSTDDHGFSRGCLDRPIGRKVQDDARAFSDLALDRHGAAMQLDQSSRYRETEANAVILPSQPAVDLGEGRRHAIDILLRNADPGIDHR